MSNHETIARRLRLEKLFTSVARGEYHPDGKLISNSILRALNRLKRDRDRILAGDKEALEKHNAIAKGETAYGYR